MLYMTLSACLLGAGLALAAGVQAANTAIPAWAVKVEGRALAKDQAWLATWPGVSWQARFDGSAVGVRLDDSRNYYLLQVDGQTVREIEPASGERVVWARNLPPGPHLAALIKRTESPQYAGRFAGFALENGRVLQAPPVRQRKIEVLGDSWTAAYGNRSVTRNCSEDDITRTTDASQGYAALLGRALDADVRVVAHSGLGVVRNWNGSLPALNFASYYPRVLQDRPLAAPGNQALDDGAWQPQVVVISLGINDFSTSVNPGEPRSQEQLARDYVAGYHRLIASVRERYGDVAMVLTGTYLWPDDRLRPLAAQVANEQRAQGRSVAYVEWRDIELTSCNWHPSLADHRKMAEQVLAGIRSLGSVWY